MHENVGTSRSPFRAWFARTSSFFAFWQILAGLSLMNCLVGLVAALIATWTSLRLMPPGQWRFRPFKLARYALRFLRQSIVAGVDVAWRALHPRMPLQPGFVVFRPKLPACSTLDAFCTVSSLLPGTLPSGPDVSGGLSIHCLDVSQPVARQLAEEEALFVGALEKGTAMTDFYFAIATFILAMVALGLLRIVRGPAVADRMMAAQLLGSGGVAISLLLCGRNDKPIDRGCRLAACTPGRLCVRRVRQRCACLFIGIRRGRRSMMAHALDLFTRHCGLERGLFLPGWDGGLAAFPEFADPPSRPDQGRQFGAWTHRAGSAAPHRWIARCLEAYRGVAARAAIQRHGCAAHCARGAAQRAAAMTAALPFEIALAALLLAVAAWIVATRTAFAATVAFIVYGLLLCARLGHARCCRCGLDRGCDRKRRYRRASSRRRRTPARDRNDVGASKPAVQARGGRLVRDHLGRPRRRHAGSAGRCTDACASRDGKPGGDRSR